MDGMGGGLLLSTSIARGWQPEMPLRCVTAITAGQHVLSQTPSMFQLNNAKIAVNAVHVMWEVTLY